ncbi:flagellar basal-body rod protein FlgG [Pseudomonas aeruginosa]
MMSALSTSKTGLEAMQTNMDVISNNLANAKTNGFKAQRASFEDLYYQNLRQPGAQSSQQTNLPSGLQVGTGVRTVATERLHTQGTMEATGNERDLAIMGNGYLQVLMPDGTMAYTRDGSLQIDKNGQLVTAGGYTIEPAIVVPDNALSMSVAKDGTVSVTQPGTTESVQIGQIQLATFVNEQGLQSVGENLFVETDSSGPRVENLPGVNGAGTIMQKYVEGSNVSVVAEMVNMIQAQRIYEINSKVTKTSDEMLGRLTQL